MTTRYDHSCSDKDMETWITPWIIWRIPSPNLCKKINFFGGHESFLWGHWYPCFGLLVTSSLAFKTQSGQLYSSLRFFVNLLFLNAQWTNFSLEATKTFNFGHYQSIHLCSCYGFPSCSPASGLCYLHTTLRPMIPTINSQFYTCFIV